jgi:hypothetical protein
VRNVPDWIELCVVVPIWLLERVRVKCGELNEVLKGYVRVVSHEFEVVR